mmetsp:Transcript_122013/g.356473  ORF Transcript_122013/g.356473 Transcript_122013/m.356473 type:complete len:201 (+) Transcript_122013:691-1293(+)
MALLYARLAPALLDIAPEPVLAQVIHVSPTASGLVKVVANAAALLNVAEHWDSMCRVKGPECVFVELAGRAHVRLEVPLDGDRIPLEVQSIRPHLLVNGACSRVLRIHGHQLQGMLADLVLNWHHILKDLCTHSPADRVHRANEQRRAEGVVHLCGLVCFGLLEPVLCLHGSAVVKRILGACWGMASDPTNVVMGDVEED